MKKIIQKLLLPYFNFYICDRNEMKGKRYFETFNTY